MRNRHRQAGFSHCFLFPILIAWGVLSVTIAIPIFSRVTRGMNLASPLGLLTIAAFVMVTIVNPWLGLRLDKRPVVAFALLLLSVLGPLILVGLFLGLIGWVCERRSTTMESKDNDNEMKKVVQSALDGYDASRDTMLRDVLFSSFSKRMRWASILSLGCIVAYSAIAVTAGVAFFSAMDLGQKVLWATVFLAAMGMIVVTKLWYWMLANRNGLSREIKRLELQVAKLSERLGGQAE